MKLSGLVTPRPAFRLRRRTCSQLALTSCCLQAGLGNDNDGDNEDRACLGADNVSAAVSPVYIWFNFPTETSFSPASPIKNLFASLIYIYSVYIYISVHHGRLWPGTISDSGSRGVYLPLRRGGRSVGPGDGLWCM